MLHKTPNRGKANAGHPPTSGRLTVPYGEGRRFNLPLAGRFEAILKEKDAASRPTAAPEEPESPRAVVPAWEPLLGRASAKTAAVGLPGPLPPRSLGPANSA